jgi:hypothetical protein
MMFDGCDEDEENKKRKDETQYCYRCRLFGHKSWTGSE